MKGRKDLLDIEALSVEEINFLLETAQPFIGALNSCSATTSA